MILKIVLASTLAFWVLVRIFDRKNQAANVAALAALFLGVVGYIAIDVIDFATYSALEYKFARPTRPAVDYDEDPFADDDF
ncbi:MAG: hypothetical protein IKU86_09680 [Thermoguttaceae bacterium]|nr:hypothetical protein [Thermoguttaceae bacterium]